MSTTPSKVRYTAVVDIFEIVETEATTAYRGETKPGSKDSKELAKIVVRDETLEGLKTKLAKHVELV